MNDILNMQPGRELDALVATKIMGINIEQREEHDWHKNDDGEIDEFRFESGHHNGPVCKRCGYSYCVLCSGETDWKCVITPRRYSTDIVAAWEVEDKLYSIGAEMSMIYVRKLIMVMNLGEDRRISTLAKLIRATPEQRCKAALLALQE